MREMFQHKGGDMWKLFSINKKESLVEILKRYTVQEKEVFVYCIIKDMDEKSLRDLIWETHPTLHIHRNPPKTKPPKEKKVRKSYAKAGMFI
jgi:hypothetical protein